MNTVWTIITLIFSVGGVIATLLAATDIVVAGVDRLLSRPSTLPAPVPPTLPRILTTDEKIEILYQLSLRPSRSQMWNLVWSVVGIVSGYALGVLNPLSILFHH